MTESFSFLACGFCNHVGDAQCDCSLVYDEILPKILSDEREQAKARDQVDKNDGRKGSTKRGIRTARRFGQTR